MLDLGDERFGVSGADTTTGHRRDIGEVGVLRPGEDSTRPRQHIGTVIDVDVELAGRDGVEPGVTARPVDLDTERIRNARRDAVDADLPHRAVGQFDGQQRDVIGVDDSELDDPGMGRRVMAVRIVNIELRYSADPEAPNQANFVQAAIDSNVDGIAVTLAKPDAMAPAVQAAEAADIPVVALNNGFDLWTSLGVQQYFGQDEALSGRTAGERLTTDGARKVVCVIHEQGNISLEARCDGVRQGFKGTIETLNVNSKDMPSVEAAVTAKLQQDPAVDHIMALDASIALTAVQSKANAGSDAVIDTFDTNAELVTAINNGDVGWAIDQQPFLQGYLAIDALWLYLNNRNIIGGGTPVLTGPAFIDVSNVESIAEFAARGTR